MKKERLELAQNIKIGLLKTGKKCYFEMKVIFSIKGSTADLSGSERVNSLVLPISMWYVKHLKKMLWSSFSFSGTGSLMPIEVMTHSDK